MVQRYSIDWACNPQIAEIPTSTSNSVEFVKHAKNCLIRKLIVSGIFLLVLSATLAEPKAPVEISPDTASDSLSWGVVQSEERVEQINRYQEKLRELAEHPERADPNESHADYLNRIEERRRLDEIVELKCQICSIRCQIVRDAGHTSCTGASGVESDESCKHQADQFMESCLQQCKFC